MVIVLIRTQLRPDADLVAYEQLDGEMVRLVESLPGFISANGYRSDNGDAIGMIRFESLEALRVWRDHPEHLEAQRRGRDEFYATYDIEVCDVVRTYNFGHAGPNVRTGDA